MKKRKKAGVVICLATCDALPQKPNSDNLTCLNYLQSAGFQVLHSFLYHTLTFLKKIIVWLYIICPCLCLGECMSHVCWELLGVSAGH